MNIITRSALTVLLSLPLGFASAYENRHEGSPQKMDSKEIAQSIALRDGFGRSSGRGYRGDGYRYERRGEWRGDGYYYGYPRYGYYPTPYYNTPYYYQYDNPSRDDQNIQYYYYGY